MDVFLQVTFGILFLYVAALTVMALTKKGVPMIMFTIGRYGIALLAIVTTVYYLFIK
mgnify:CR=1 FL=1|tara:strand:- start:1090 stop:1260 length:171 start_codon:yes stop_codon:yes gene_type:complete